MGRHHCGLVDLGTEPNTCPRNLVRPWAILHTRAHFWTMGASSAGAAVIILVNLGTGTHTATRGRESPDSMGNSLPYADVGDNRHRHLAAGVHHTSSTARDQC